MASLKNLEMGSAVSSHKDIIIEKSFLGMRQTIVYQPTQSIVDIKVQEYAPEEGKRIERLLNTPADQVEKAVDAMGKLKTVPVGNVRLEACLARDHQFAAVQMSRFSDFMYRAETPVCFFTGRQAEAIARLFE